MTQPANDARVEQGIPENPYVGPRTFEATQVDRKRFFGRAREARELLAIVTAERLTLFYAQSGAGKSSLVNARLIPALADKGFEVLPVGRVGGVDAQAPADSNPFVYNLMRHMAPREKAAARFAKLTLADFLGRLAYLDDDYALVDDAALAQNREGSEEAAVLAASQAAAAPAIGIGAPANDVTAVDVPAIVPRVLIIDQFEELLTTQPGAWEKHADFFEQLTSAMSADPYLWVVLTLREDSVAGLDPYAHLTINGLRARYYMRQMEAGAAIEAITFPAAAGGRPFAPGVAEQLVENLRTVRSRGQSQSQLGQYVEPVQLQVVCYQLWEKLAAEPQGPITAEDLTKAGDVDLALESFYDTALGAALSEAATAFPQWRVRDWFDKQLITAADTRGTVFVDETRTAGLPNDIVRSLAKRFLLRLEPRAGGTWCELMHDRFIQPIRQSNRRWLNQQDPLLRAAVAWELADRNPAQLYAGLQLKEALTRARNVDDEALVAEFLATSKARVAAQRRELWQEAPARDPRATGFARSLALLIGIDQYGVGLPQLTTAAGDATQLAQLLREQHGYYTHVLTEDVTLEQLEVIFVEALPGKVRPEDRLLIYFAGHGVALDSESGPRGYLAPQDANPESSSTILSFDAVFQWLNRLPCRHLLVFLDCNFAGDFTWSGAQPLRAMPETLYREHYERFIQGNAWQLLHSTADVAQTVTYWAGGSIGERRREGDRSVYAAALCRALAGDADALPLGNGDHLITATELQRFLRTARAEDALAALPGAVPPSGLWPLKPPGMGEYCFFTPGQQPQLAPAPAATPGNNPYLGIKPFEEADKELFFGREVLVAELAQRVAQQPLTVVVGASGTGKSSLVKAGLIPRLRAARHDVPWHVLSPIRPADAPLRVLQNLFATELNAGAATVEGAVGTLTPDLTADAVFGMADTWLAANAPDHLFLVVDQLEELVTITQSREEGEAVIAGLAELIHRYPERLHVVLTLRSDFTPLFSKSALGGMLASRWEDALFPARPMTREELRAAIVGPAARYAIAIEPPELTDTLIDEVISAPGALSMLSFTLSELYLMYAQREAASQQQGTPPERALTLTDYQQLKGVSGSLERRAEEVYAQLGRDFDASYQATLERVMLRMIAAQGNELARRRVPTAELEFPLAAENERVRVIVKRLEDAQLCVRGSDDAGVSFVEPAHDALVRAWGRLLEWKRAADEYLSLQRRLNQAAVDWERDNRQPKYLWTDDPRLTQLQEIAFPGAHARAAGTLARIRNTLWPSIQVSAQPTWLNALETEFVRDSVVRHAGFQQRFVAITSLFVLIMIGLLLWAFLANQSATQAQLQLAKAAAMAASAQNEAIQAGATAVGAESKANQAAATAASVLAQRAVEQRQIAEQMAMREHVKGEEAQREKAITQANDLAEQALAGQATQPVQSLLLAVEAVTATWGLQDESGLVHVAAAEQALRNALQRTGGTPLSGHENRVNAAAFSPDGRWLASASDDTTTRLWDMRNPGLPPVVLRGHTAPVTGLAFSGDGRWLATVGADRVTYLWDQPALGLATQPLTITTAGPSGSGIAFTPDSRFFVTMGFLSTKGGTQSAVYVQDLAATATPLTRTLNFDANSKLQSVALAPDGRLLATIGVSQTVDLWNVLDGVLEARLALDDPLAIGVTFSPDGAQLAVIGADGAVTVWDTATGAELTAVQGSSGTNIVTFSPDGARITTTDGAFASIWDVASSRLLSKLGQPASAPPEALSNVPMVADLLAKVAQPPPVQMVSFSPDGRQLAVVGEDRTIHLWDVATGQELAVLAGHSGTIRAAVFSPDGKRLVTAGDDRTVRLWDPTLTSGEPLVRSGHTGPIAHAVFSPDERWLASASADAQLLLWEAANATAKPRTLHAGPRPLTDLAFSGGSNFLATAGGEPVVQYWPILLLDTPPYTLTHPTAIDKIAFSPNNRWLAALGTAGPIYLWDVTTLPDENSPIFKRKAQVEASPELAAPFTASLPPISTTLDSQGGFVTTVVFSDDSRWMAAISADGPTQLWNLDAITSSSTPVVLSDPGGVVGAAFTPASGQLITVGKDHVARAWAIEDFKPVTATMTTLCTFDTRIVNAALSTTGKWLAAADDNFAVELCNLQSSPPELTILAGHQDRLLDLAFSPREDWLISASADGTARLWDVSEPTGEAVVLGGQAGSIRRLAVSPDGRWLATGGDDALVRQWRLQQEELVTLACRVAATNLTSDEWEQFFGADDYRQTCPEWPVHPSVAQLHLRAGEALARQGYLDRAVKEFATAQQIDRSLDYDPRVEAEQVASQSRRASPSGKFGVYALGPIEPQTGLIAPQVEDPNFIADTGAGWVRLNFMLGNPWSSPNDQNRPFGLTWVETYRTIIDGYRSQGMRIYGLLGAEIVREGPGDQFRDPPPPGITANEWITRYVDTYVEILHIFKDDLSVVEALNEPDDWHSGNRNWIHPGWYAIIQQALYGAVRRDPELDHIKLVSAPVLGLDVNNNGGAKYLEMVYAEGKARFGWGQPGVPFPFDGVGYHLYVGEGASDPLREVARMYEAFTQELQQVIQAAEGQTKPIYLSEVGWPSDTAGGEEAQALVLRSLLSRIAGDPAIALGVWFGLQDFGHQAYGLYRADGLTPANRKPAYTAFKAVMNGDLAANESASSGPNPPQSNATPQATPTPAITVLDDTFWQRSGIARRLGAWFDDMNLSIVPIAQRPDQPDGDVVYVVKDVFTTRDGSWETSDQLGAIDPWAREDYLRPWGAPDFFDDAGGDHHLFAAVIGLDGELIRDQNVRYWPDGIARLGEPKYQDYVTAKTKSGSGWANLPVFSKYDPGNKEAGDWCWTLDEPAEVVCGGGLPNGAHVSTFVVWQAVQR